MDYVPQEYPKYVENSGRVAQNAEEEARIRKELGLEKPAVAAKVPQKPPAPPAPK